MDQASFYDSLNYSTLWVRWNGQLENRFSALANPALAVLRARPLDEVTASDIERMQAEYLRLFNLPPHLRSRMPLPGQSLLETAELVLKDAPGIRTVMFSGYSLDPDSEGAEVREQFAATLASRGLDVLLSDRAASVRWISKPAFCAQVEALYGPGSSPPGATLMNVTTTELVAATQDALRSSKRSVILKRNGSHGSGNLLVNPGDALDVRVAAFLAQPLDPAAPWVRVEHWLPWESSYCCSFFIRGEGEPFFVALTQQIISPSRARLVGSRGGLDLDPKDAETVVDLLRPLIRRMQRDGIRGFTGVDLIVSRTGDWAGGLRLPSGRGVRLVECNPRVNRHNQMLKIVSLIAARDGCTLDEYRYLMLDIFASDGKSLDVQRVGLAAALAGVVAPLGPEPISDGEARYLLCPAVGDYFNILFVARGTTAAPQLSSLYTYLRERDRSLIDPV